MFRYPVAYTGPDSAFEKDWLKAGGVRGIPHAFVVKNGKLLFTTHPKQLTDQLVTKIAKHLAAAVTADEGETNAHHSR